MIMQKWFDVIQCEAVWKEPNSLKEKKVQTLYAMIIWYDEDGIL